MGLKKKGGIPWEVEDAEGNVSSDRCEILSCWKRDFAGLLTPPTSNTPEQEEFVEFIKKEI